MAGSHSSNHLDYKWTYFQTIGKRIVHGYLEAVSLRWEPRTSVSGKPRAARTKIPENAGAPPRLLRLFHFQEHPRMATEAQIAANRESAKHSTGPKTEGRAKSCMNNFRWGFTGAFSVLSSESQEDFDDLPQPRLKPVNGVVMVPLYTDFKLHDICNGPTDPNRELLNQNAPAGSAEFFTGNERFLTRRLWAVGSKPNYFHHGQFTTIREAILNHFGEASSDRSAFVALTKYEQGAIIEFLKTLRAVPAQN